MLTADEFKETLQEKGIKFSQNPETKRIFVKDILDSEEVIEICVDFMEDNLIVVSIPICDFEEAGKGEQAMQLAQELNNTSIVGKYIMVEDSLWLLGYVCSSMASGKDVIDMLCILCSILDSGDYARFMKIKWS